MSDGTPIVANKVTGAATTGTVSVVNLVTGQGDRGDPGRAASRRPSTSTADGTLFVANSNDDSFSMIDTATATRRRRPSTSTRCPARPSAATPTRSRCRTPTPSWSASAGTTRSRSTATAARARRCSTRGCCRPTSTRSTRSYDAGDRQGRRHQRQGHRRPRPGQHDRQGRAAPRPRRHRSPATTPTTTPARSPRSRCRRTAALAADTHQVFVNNDWEHLLASTPAAARSAHAGRHPRHARRPVDDQARLPDRQGEPHLRPGPR